MIGRALAFPVTGPLGGLLWIARQVAQLADEQRLDPKRIEAALLTLERRLEAGEIDDATFEAEEAALLAELRAIRAARQGQQGQG
ncbi:gas vesicle protein GvpG [Roseomonas sp. GC11]|uniref:gas vesicle protein GvpG n=1 Tax=Roseomonas sp. GC11 TaxID=2950546 RepID=UPI002108AE57|nr:gas vesicle protein GvpG [Roseomonas sp. GC11]MCQ4161676.1 gas vesicle protein GvpG [Roseomonas sp. GC11]